MSLQKTLTAYGPIEFYGKDEYIGRSLYAYGEWSGEEAEMIASLRDGLALDVGANVGFMSMAMGHCIAFEPQPALYELLCRNHGATWSFPYALSNKCGTAIMPRIRYNSKGNFGGLSLGHRSELGYITVQCVTLDSVIAGLEPSLIKIDVEGHELEVLQGAIETIKRCRPILYVEDDRPTKRAALRGFISSLGYSIEEHQPLLFRENNFAGNPVNIWGRDIASHNIICRPC